MSSGKKKTRKQNGNKTEPVVKGLITGRQASLIGTQQIEVMSYSVLFDKFQWTQSKINSLTKEITTIEALFVDKGIDGGDTIDWVDKHNLRITFTENCSFMPNPMVKITRVKLRCKTTAVAFFMYILKYKFKFTYKDLEKYKACIMELQDSIDKKYLSYDDIFKEQIERGLY